MMPFTFAGDGDTLAIWRKRQHAYNRGKTYFRFYLFNLPLGGGTGE